MAHSRKWAGRKCRGPTKPALFSHITRSCGPPVTGPNRCEIHYRGALSPDFYAWIFPHGDTMSVGVGCAQRGFSLKSSVSRLREATGLKENATLRGEGRADTVKIPAPLG